MGLARFFSTHPLTRDTRLQAWSRFVLWQIRSRIREEVIFSWIEGQKLAVRHGMFGATGNIYAGLHEFADMMLMLHFLREGDLFLDVGSNIGSYTILASGVSRAETWAFEPDPATARILRRNIMLNGLDERVRVHELAIGETDGDISFTCNGDTVNHVVTDAQRCEETRIVPIRRLDFFAAERCPIMIKMDVEGHEEAALRGAKTLLEGDSLKVFEIETLTSEIEATLEGNGFVRAYYDPFRRELTKVPNDVPASNSLFVRDWDFVTTRLATAPTITVLGRSI